MSTLRWLVYWLCIFGCCSCAATSQELQKNQQQGEVHYKLGVSYLQANNPTMALKEFLQAVEYQPQDSANHVALAQAYQLKKSYLNAERHYLKALELEPGEPSYQNNLASLYLDMGEWQKAADYFAEAAGNLIFLNPHVALTGKGYALYRKGDHSAALASFDEAMEAEPRYAPAYFYKSEVLGSLEQHEQALELLERAVELAPQYVQARYQLAILLLKENRIEEAADEFQAVVNLVPESQLGNKAAEYIKSLKKR